MYDSYDETAPAKKPSVKKAQAQAFYDGGDADRLYVEPAFNYNDEQAAGGGDTSGSGGGYLDIQLDDGDDDEEEEEESEEESDDDEEGSANSPNAVHQLGL
jgi:hypothetical protein